MTVTSEQVAAYADGQLEGEEARLVAAAVAGDPRLQAEVEAHRALRTRLSAHFATVAQAPVPESLRAAVLAGESADIVDLAAARIARRPREVRGWLRYAAPALAASLLLVVFGFNAWEKRGYADDQLAGVLDHQLAMTAPANASVRVLLSFRDKGGQFCRAFHADAGSGIACRDDRGWRLQDLPGKPSSQQTEYRQAGSEDAGVMAAAQEMAAAPALDAKAEAAAVAHGWRP